jgi:geranylgeranyl diphosphate synthase, type III
MSASNPDADNDSTAGSVASVTDEEAARGFVSDMIPPSPVPLVLPPASPQKAHVLGDSSLFEPFRYISTVPGKNIRGILIDCFQVWLQVPDDDGEKSVLSSIKSVIGDLHNASLLIDDIEDNSKLRRGIPAAHVIYGEAAVINCANYVYFLALEKCLTLQPQSAASATQVFTSELLNLHRGQGYDIYWRDHYTCPTEEQYIQMVLDKTGGLFRLAVRLMQCFATSPQMTQTDFVPLVNNLAIYFQIRDDYLNLCNDSYHKSKSFCEDITEGKFSFPILHCINQGGSSGADTRMISILKQRTQDIEVKKYALTLLEETNSFQYALDKCCSLYDTLIEQIGDLGGNPMLLRALNELHAPLAQPPPEPTNEIVEIS